MDQLVLFFFLLFFLRTERGNDIMIWTKENYILILIPNGEDRDAKLLHDHCREKISLPHSPKRVSYGRRASYTPS